MPSAAAYSHGELVSLTEVARLHARNARMPMVAPIAQRRPCPNRSRAGPISGATTANGSIVSPRNSATWPRASPVGTWKNNVPASEIATAASPAALSAPSSISRARPVVSAPSAPAARRAVRKAERPTRPVTRATEATPRPVARAPVVTESRGWRSGSSGIVTAPTLWSDLTAARRWVIMAP